MAQNGNVIKLFRQKIIQICQFLAKLFGHFVQCLVQITMLLNILSKKLFKNLSVFGKNFLNFFVQIAML